MIFVNPAGAVRRSWNIFVYYNYSKRFQILKNKTRRRLLNLLASIFIVEALHLLHLKGLTEATKIFNRLVEAPGVNVEIATSDIFALE